MHHAGAIEQGGAVAIAQRPLELVVLQLGCEHAVLRSAAAQLFDIAAELRLPQGMVGDRPAFREHARIFEKKVFVGYTDACRQQIAAQLVAASARRRADDERAIGGRGRLTVEFGTDQLHRIRALRLRVAIGLDRHLEALETRHRTTLSNWPAGPPQSAVLSAEYHLQAISSAR